MQQWETVTFDNPNVESLDAAGADGWEVFSVEHYIVTTGRGWRRGRWWGQTVHLRRPISAPWAQRWEYEMWNNPTERSIDAARAQGWEVVGRVPYAITQGRRQMWGETVYLKHALPPGP